MDELIRQSGTVRAKLRNFETFVRTLNSFIASGKQLRNLESLQLEEQYEQRKSLKTDVMI